jgi:DNA-binding LytR/AlgR family response regulator
MSRKRHKKSKKIYHIRRAFFITHPELILYCEALGSYTIIYFKGHDPERPGFRICIIEQQLDKEQFFRCHESYIIKLFCIESIVCCNRNMKLILTTGVPIPVARQYKKEVVALFDKILKQRFQ